VTDIPMRRHEPRSDESVPKAPTGRHCLRRGVECRPLDHRRGLLLSGHGKQLLQVIVVDRL